MVAGLGYGRPGARVVVSIADINQALDELDILAIACANGDGDHTDCVAAAEDALLFKVLSAIANGVPDPQGLAAHVIDACAYRLRGRCFKDARATGEMQDV